MAVYQRVLFFFLDAIFLKDSFSLCFSLFSIWCQFGQDSIPDFWPNAVVKCNTSGATIIPQWFPVRKTLKILALHGFVWKWRVRCPIFKPIQDGAFWGPGEGPWSQRSAANVQKLAISGIKTKWHDYRGVILYILPKFVEDYNSKLKENTLVASYVGTYTTQFLLGIMTSNDNPE